jgi:hypothetical protein
VNNPEWLAESVTTLSYHMYTNMLEMLKNTLEHAVVIKNRLKFPRVHSSRLLCHPILPHHAWLYKSSTTPHTESMIEAESSTFLHARLHVKIRAFVPSPTAGRGVVKPTHSSLAPSRLCCNKTQLLHISQVKVKNTLFISKEQLYIQTIHYTWHQDQNMQLEDYSSTKY